MLGVDYQRARAVLRERRFELQMRVRDLAEKAGVSRITIYHLEKIEKEPDHEPDFKTLEKLAAAMELTLSDLFLRIEGLNRAEPTDKNAVTKSDGAAGVVPRTASPLPLDDTNAVIAGNSAALVRLARTLEAIGTELGRLRADREQDAAASVHKSGRHARPRKAG